MTFLLPRLAIASLFMAALIAPARAYNPLVNGDFHDGKTHWEGDGDASDSGGPLVITLKPDKWTAVRQTFSADCQEARLKITYSVSADCSFLAKKSSDGTIPSLTAHALDEATTLQNGISPVIMDSSNSCLVLMVAGGYLYWQYPFALEYKKDGTRTFSTTTEWGPVTHVDLCIAFPPGHGTVTLVDVELIPSKDR